MLRKMLRKQEDLQGRGEKCTKYKKTRRKQFTIPQNPNILAVFEMTPDIWHYTASAIL